MTILDAFLECESANLGVKSVVQCVSMWKAQNACVASPLRVSWQPCNYHIVLHQSNINLVWSIQWLFSGVLTYFHDVMHVLKPPARATGTCTASSAHAHFHPLNFSSGRFSDSLTAETEMMKMYLGSISRGFWWRHKLLIFFWPGDWDQIHHSLGSIFHSHFSGTYGLWNILVVPRFWNWHLLMTWTWQTWNLDFSTTPKGSVEL